MAGRLMSSKRYVPLSEFGREFRERFRDNPFVDQTLRELLLGYVGEGFVDIEYDPGLEGFWVVYARAEPGSEDL